MLTNETSEYLADTSTLAEPGRKGSRLSRRLLALTLAMILMGSAYLLRAPILVAVANILIVRDALDRANMIVLLNGDFINRPRTAAQLIQAGLAERVLIAQVKKSEAEEYGLLPDRTLLHVQMLGKLGVPESSVVTLKLGDGVTSTFQEALSIKQYVSEHPDQRRLILVTSAFHTRRARWIFQKALEGLGVEIQVAPASYGTFDESNWWRDEDGVIYCFNEYIKLIYYWFKY